MKSKTSRMAFAFIFLLFFVLLVKPGRLAYSNYLGECSDTKTRVTDKEKIDAAIEKIFSYYPKNNQELHRWFAMPYLSAREGATPERYPIPYKDLEEFKAINPDCCRVVRQPSDVEDAPAALFDQLAGTKGSFVEVHFLLRYRERGDEIKTLENKVTYAVTNCGTIWNGI